MERGIEGYVRVLAERAERAVKLLKIFIGAALVALLTLAVYSLVVYSLTAFANLAENQGLLIGFIVITVCLLVLVICVFAALAYAFYNLNKLDKLK